VTHTNLLGRPHGRGQSLEDLNDPDIMLLLAGMSAADSHQAPPPGTGHRTGLLIQHVFTIVMRVAAILIVLTVLLTVVWFLFL
jgi:hypothetical protein